MTATLRQAMAAARIAQWSRGSRAVVLGITGGAEDLATSVIQDAATASWKVSKSAMTATLQMGTDAIRDAASCAGGCASNAWT